MSSNNFVLLGIIISTIVLTPLIQNSFAETGSVTIETHQVKYNIENGKIDSIFLDPDFLQLIITMTTQNDGAIELTIPREVLDAKFDTTDDIFFVLVDGFETDYVEISSIPNSRTIVIPFFSGDSIIEIIGTTASNPFASSPESVIPIWVKNNAGWWANGLIADSDFVSGIQYLINQGIMTIPPTESGKSSGTPIPGWIKNNAGWWADGQIDDTTFVSGIQYLISNGIMQV